MSRDDNGCIVKDGHVSSPCDSCGCEARWSICNMYVDVLGDAPPQWIVAWFACGRHLSRVLSDGVWEMDAVVIYDLSEPTASS
jgi:hypothetical protein